MIKILKSRTIPPLLLKEIKSGAIDYEKHLSPRAKAQLRRVLLEDQGYLCCYCQRRLPQREIPKSKIEHFKSQKANLNLQLDFTNLFVACNGIGNKKEFTCDTKKDNMEITSFNLLLTDFLTKIKYTKFGTVISTDTAISNEIKNIINLNDENLIKARVQVYQAIEFIKRKQQQKGKYDQGMKKEIAIWENKFNGKYKEFKGVGLYFLNK